MTTSVELLGILARSCEQLRQAGLPDDRIEEFAKRWLVSASAAELEGMVDRLSMLEETARSGAGDTTAVFEDVMRTMDRIGGIASRPEALDHPAGENPAPTGGPKYPDVRVSLAGLEGQFWPILRRVAYAMSDAGIDDEEVERYKNEMKDSQDDPLGVSRRWVEIA
jgi:hypothetical protein